MANGPLNIHLLDVDKFIREHGCKEVTSTFVHAPSSNQFHEAGLFSEQIFGNIADQKRLITFGYINLNCKIFAPHVFQIIQSLKMKRLKPLRKRTVEINQRLKLQAITKEVFP